MIRLKVPAGKPAVIEERRPRERRDGSQEHRSRVGTNWRPSAAPEGSGADWANAKKYFTFPSTDDWVARFTKEPDIWHNLLGDIYRETKAERERKGGQARIGRRPRAIDGSMDELWEMVTPQYSMEPFKTSLMALVQQRGVSMLRLAQETRIPRTTINDMVAGKLSPDMWRLEQLAKYFEISPSYFREFRESYVLTVMSELLAANPNLSIRFARGITKAAEKSLPHRPPRRVAR